MILLGLILTIYTGHWSHLRLIKPLSTEGTPRGRFYARARGNIWHSSSILFGSCHIITLGFSVRGLSVLLEVPWERRSIERRSVQVTMYCRGCKQPYYKQLEDAELLSRGVVRCWWKGEHIADAGSGLVRLGYLAEVCSVANERGNA